MRKFWIVSALLASGASANAEPSPIIDMHLHAMAADAFGPPGTSICAPYEPWPIREHGRPITDYLRDFKLEPKCARRLIAPQTTAAIRDQSLAALKRHNIIAVTSGAADLVEDYRARAPDRIIPAITFGLSELPSIAELRALHGKGRLKVIGEEEWAGIVANA